MRIIFISLLCFYFVTIYAQDNITVSIKKTFVDDKVLAIRTTITNNNNEAIYIPIRSNTDDYGNAINGGSTYLRLNVYDNNNNKVTIQSNYLYYTYNPDYPLLNNENRIILKKGQSIEKTYRLYSYDGIRGFLNLNEAIECKLVEVKLHIMYIYLLDDSVHTKDLISNRITLY